MCFAYDLLLFAKGDLNSVKALSNCFSQFSAASGLKANLNKSSVYFGGVPIPVQQQILNHLGYEQGQLPFKYLGVPLSTKKITLLQWQPLVEKITARITSWSARTLSYSGRLQLVQSIIFGIQAYGAQLFIFPVKVLKMIESICRSFIWSGMNTVNKKAYISWDRMCTPKSVGGMNLTNLKLWNKAAIAKTCWDIAHKKDKMWIRWITVYYIKRQDIRNHANPCPSHLDG